MPKILDAEDSVTVIEEIVKNKHFEKSDTGIETYESIEELQFPQENQDGCIIIQDDLNEKEKNDPRLQAMFKWSRHNNLSLFIISQEYYEFPKRTIRANGNIYHKFTPNNFRGVQNLYHGKASMDMTLDEFKILKSTRWCEKFYPLTIEMTKDKYIGRFRLGLNSLFLLKTNHFIHFNWVSFPNVTQQDLINWRNLAEQQKHQRTPKIKNRFLKQTYDIKKAESLSLITKKET